MPIKVSYEDVVPGDPPEEEEGRLFYDSYDRVLKYWNGFEWVFLGTAVGGYCEFDNGSGRCWPWAIRVGIMSATSEDAQYKVVIDETYVTVYAVDGTLKTQGAVAADFWDKVKEDGSDIRVFDQAKNQLYFWVEEWDYTGRNAVIWVKLPAGSTELNIAYGNPSAMKSSYENGEQVFELFDDFEGTELDASKWNEHAGGGASITVENGLLTVHTSTSGYSGAWIWSKQLLTLPFVVETKAIRHNALGGGERGTGIIAVYSDWDGSTFDSHYYYPSRAILASIYRYTTNSWYNDLRDFVTNKRQTGSYSNNLNKWCLIKLTIKATEQNAKFDFNLDGTIEDDLTITNSPNVSSFCIGLGAGDMNKDSNTQFDWVRVFKLADPAEFEEPEIITLTE